MGTYRIGLAMAGAVSAGAYSAGILDFMIEALDAWHEAKARGEAVPQHEVSVMASSGASAGSMCSALLAITLPYAYGHVRLNATRQPSGNVLDNPFYRAWVDRIGIESLLDTGDLRGGALPSYLNSSIIDEIVSESLAFHAPAKARPWVAQPFLARFSLGNLRGVPYKVDVLGAQHYGDEMIEQADHMDFAVGQLPLAPPWSGWLSDHFVLPSHDHAVTAAADWRRLGDAAVASGAFPLFLKPRKLSRPAAQYDQRHDGAKPDWNETPAPSQYDFVCMDGGIFNNEPFDLAHSALLLGKDRSQNPRGMNEADCSVLMIDPFVSRDAAKDFALQPLEALIGPLVSAWTMQARFRPEDLTLAHRDDVYSRYLIAPAGSGAPAGGKAHPLACGGLGGFLGFFHHEFRKHDFQLGRRNCQRFLQEYFTVPLGNTTVGPGYAALDAATRKNFSSSQSGEVQIIPLMPALRQEEALPQWPTGLWDLNALRPLIERRVDAVYEHYRDRIVASAGNWFKRSATQGYLWTGWKLGGVRDMAIDKAMQVLHDAKNVQGL